MSEIRFLEIPFLVPNQMNENSATPLPAANPPGSGSIPLSSAPRLGSDAEAAPPVPPPDTTAASGPDRLLFTPLIDIYETDEGLHLIADLPGVNASGLDLQVQDNKLILFGRVAPAVPPEAVLLHKEYDEGDFLRSFILSDEVDHERISAKITSGILEVALPKATRTQPRRIQVNSD